MQVTATEFKQNLGKYLELVLSEDIFVTKNGKTVAKLINPNVSAVDSISGVLAGKVYPDLDRYALREERLSRYAPVDWYEHSAGFLIRREDFYENSKAVLTLCEDRTIQGFVPASAVTDVFYLTRKALGSTEDTYKVISSILNIVRVLTVTNEDVLNAFQVKAKDFEDCLMATCAKSNKCDGIVTRNKKDFLMFGVTLYSPEELLQLLEEA